MTESACNTDISISECKFSAYSSLLHSVQHHHWKQTNKQKHLPVLSTELITFALLDRERRKMSNCFCSLRRSRDLLISLYTCKSDRPLYKLQQWLAATDGFSPPLSPPAPALVNISTDSKQGTQGTEELHLFIVTLYFILVPGNTSVCNISNHFCQMTLLWLLFFV